MRGHLECAHFQQTQASGGGFRRVELVDAELRPVCISGGIDQKIPENPVDHPRTGRFLVSDLLERNLQLIHLIVSRLIDAGGLAGRADEHPAEQIGQCRMVVPISDQAAEQIGAAQQRRIRGSRAAEDNMIAAARAGVPAVEHELFRSEPTEMSFFVQSRRALDQFIPGCGGLGVHFNHTGIGRDLDLIEAVIVRRSVTFDQHRQFQFPGRVFDGGQ
jgi:hypothetical protein